jgi:hypothetical protein
MYAERTNLEVSTFGIFTIAKDYDNYTVKITREAKRSRLGYKTLYYYTYKSIADISARIMRMNLFVDKFIEEQKAQISKKAEAKSALQKLRQEVKNPFEVGQILYKTWGYEQTNVNFYQVISVKGKTVILRELEQQRTEKGYMYGTTMPIKDSFNGGEFKRILQVRIYNGTTHVSLKDVSTWHGTPVSYSSYY